MTPHSDPWDDDHDEELESDTTVSALDAFDDYAPSAGPDGQLPPDVSFTVSNPAGTVAVTALIGGRIQRVDLEPAVTSMTEYQLAEENSTLADLATQKALAAQHGVISILMQDMGHDSGAVREFLERELGLPAPEMYLERTAAVFADRYGEQ